MRWIPRRSSRPFIPAAAPPRWEQRDTVLRHELGHALVWYQQGGSLGRLALTEVKPGCWLGRQAFGTSKQDPAENVAQRLLAGELSARQYLGLPTDVIHLDGLSDDRISVCTSAQELYSSALSNGADERSDAMKVLDLARVHHNRRWRQWVRACMQDAASVLTKQRDVIECAADQFERRLLDPADWEHGISGEELTGTLFMCGAGSPPGGVPEAV